MSEDAKPVGTNPKTPHPRLRLSDRREVLDDFQTLLVNREKNDGEVLFQGAWLKPQAARQRFQRQLLFSRVRIIEMVAVTLLLVFLTVFPFIFLGVLGGIAG